MARLSIVPLFFAATVLVSCSPPAFLPETELQAYLVDPDNGVIKKSQQEDLTVTVCYQPADLLGIASPNSNTNQSPASAPQSQYFLLTLSRNEREVLEPSQGFSAFSSLLQTLAFRPQEYLRLTTAKGDTLLPSNSELERTYGMAASTRLLIAFPLSNRGEDITFHLGEFGLRTGPLRFNFKRTDILDIPQLKLVSTKAATEIQ